MIDRFPGTGNIFAVFDRRWLVALLSFDLFLIAVHVYLGATSTVPALLSFAAERSIGEMLGYYEMGLAAVLLLITFANIREPIMLACAAMLAGIMFDDMLGIHEIGGTFLSESLQFQATDWLRGQDKGELLTWALLAGFFLSILLYGFLKTPRDRWYRAFGLLLLTGLLVVFAVAVDMSHAAVCQFNGGFPYCEPLIYLVEDGGEKLTLTLILAHVIYLMRNPSAPALFDLTQRLLPARIGALRR